MTAQPGHGTSQSSSTGPSAIPNSYQIYPNFPGTAPPAPFLLSPAPWVYQQDITVTVPAVGQSPASSTCTAPAQTDFILALNGSTATVTIKAANAWNGAPQARQTLRASFTAFIAYLDCVEFRDGAIIPGGAFSIAQQVADALPKGLDEVLFYAFSFNSGAAHGTTPYIDLQPGMRLRLEIEGQQYVGPGSAVKNFNGFVGTGRFLYDLVGYPGSRPPDPKKPGTVSATRCLGFERFLSTIAPPSITPVNPGSPAVGVIDLQAAGTQRRYARLCYPTNYIAPDSPGDQSLECNVAILQADTLSELTTATNAYMQNGECAAATSNSITCTVFRGRVVAIPEIAIWVQFGPASSAGGTLGASQELVYVSVGTTLGDIASRYGNWNAGVQVPGPTPPFAIQRVSAFPTPSRPKLYGVTLAGAQGLAAQGLFALPVVKGDSLLFWL